MRRAVLALLLPALLVSSTPARAWTRYDFSLYVTPSTCGGAGDQASIEWFHTGGVGIPARATLTIDATYDGYKWHRLSSTVPISRGIYRWRTDRVPISYPSLGMVRVRVNQIGLVQTVPLLLDHEAPKVQILGVSGEEPTVDVPDGGRSRTLIVAGKANLRALASDEGVGFRHGGGEIMYYAPRPTLLWNLHNEMTGTDEIITVKQRGGEFILNSQPYDFSAHPGRYTVTATAIDCVGNTATSEPIDVIGLPT